LSVHFAERKEREGHAKDAKKTFEGIPLRPLRTFAPFAFGCRIDAGERARPPQWATHHARNTNQFTLSRYSQDRGISAQGCPQVMHRVVPAGHYI
jgi:hypothetical protein